MHSCKRNRLWPLVCWFGSLCQWFQSFRSKCNHFQAGWTVVEHEISTGWLWLGLQVCTGAWGRDMPYEPLVFPRCRALAGRLVSAVRAQVPATAVLCPLPGWEGATCWTMRRWHACWCCCSWTSPSWTPPGCSASCATCATTAPPGPGSCVLCCPSCRGHQSATQTGMSSKQPGLMEAPRPLPAGAGQWPPLRKAARAARGSSSSLCLPRLWSLVPRGQAGRAATPLAALAPGCPSAWRQRSVAVPMSFKFSVCLAVKSLQLHHLRETVWTSTPRRPLLFVVTCWTLSSPWPKSFPTTSSLDPRSRRYHPAIPKRTKTVSKGWQSLPHHLGAPGPSPKRRPAGPPVPVWPALTNQQQRHRHRTLAVRNQTFGRCFWGWMGPPLDARAKACRGLTVAQPACWRNQRHLAVTTTALRWVSWWPCLVTLWCDVVSCWPTDCCDCWGSSLLAFRRALVWL